MNKIIEFYTQPEVAADKSILPIPVKLNIPEWFKKLDGKKELVKNCMPFLDTITTGYALKTTSDIYVNHNFLDDNNQPSTVMKCPYEINPHFYDNLKINVNKLKDAEHPRWQLEGSPILNKNSNLKINKIVYPFTVRTPKNYSCLFVPPLNNKDDRFEIIPGIVDTDTFPMETNFPFIVNGDKYSKLEFTIKKGTVFAQIIPFKRENWKMIIKEERSPTSDNYIYRYFTKFKHKYKNMAWNKKTFR